MIRKLAKQKVGPFAVIPGDTISVCKDEEELVRADIETAMLVDEVVVFEFEDEFDLKQGVGGVLGKSTDS